MVLVDGKKAVESYITAQGSVGEAAVVAYTARRPRPGPNGEAYVAFVLRTTDRGATWTDIPLTRGVWSFLYYWGFPVWPPEFVSKVDVGPGTVLITFRDEEVLYEPGGESLWTGTLSPHGVWTIRRVRLMQYGPSGDDASAPLPVPFQLPGVAAPDGAVVERAAARAAAYSAAEVPGWLWLVPGLATGLLIGAGAITTAIGLVVAAAVGLPVAWFLLDRQRQRRAVRER